jgi:putative spermidine/putrescine transport system permease protein
MSSISLSDAPRPRATSSLSMKLKNPALLLLPAVGFLAFIYLLPLIDLIRISISGPSWLT